MIVCGEGLARGRFTQSLELSANRYGISDVCLAEFAILHTFDCSGHVVGYKAPKRSVKAGIGIAPLPQRDNEGRPRQHSLRGNPALRLASISRRPQGTTSSFGHSGRGFFLYTQHDAQTSRASFPFFKVRHVVILIALARVCLGSSHGKWHFASA